MDNIITFIFFASLFGFIFLNMLFVEKDEKIDWIFEKISIFLIVVSINIFISILYLIVFSSPLKWDHKTDWNIETEEKVKEAVCYFSNDPDEVGFRNIFKVDEGTWCGEVNLPSHEGGMLGFRKFVIHDGNIDNWSVNDDIMNKYCSEWRENLLDSLSSN